MSELSFRRMQESDLDAVLAVEFAAFSHPWTRGIFLDCIQSGHECWRPLNASRLATACYRLPLASRIC